MLTIESLKAFGANTDEGMARCLNNEAFYLRLAGKALADANFEKLRAAVAAQDAKAAFDACHALKGSIGNLAITPIYNPVSEITEKLRGRTDMDGIAELADEVFAQLEKARSL